MRYVRLEEAVRGCGVPRELLEALLDVELIRPRPTLDADRVISTDEADDLRVARLLLEELGVNVEGVEVILHMRRRQIELQQRLDRILAALEAFGPRGLLPGP